MKLSDTNCCNATPAGWSTITSKSCQATASRSGRKPAVYIKTYKVRYARTGDIFTKPFTKEHGGLLTSSCANGSLVFNFDGVSKLKALELVNEWNRQNATSGFTYWID